MYICPQTNFITDQLFHKVSLLALQLRKVGRKYRTQAEEVQKELASRCKETPVRRRARTRLEASKRVRAVPLFGTERSFPAKEKLLQTLLELVSSNVIP